MNQEPGTKEEIAEFCKRNYGVTFQMMDKVSTKEKTKFIYQWLTQKKEWCYGFKVTWNFQKYLITKMESWSILLSQRRVL